MTWKEFSDLSKSLFVVVATEEFGLKGRPTNVSRVSILTGISRKEVKRQRDLAENKQPPTRSKTTDATRVLSAWYQDPDYLDTDTAPLLLKETGPKPSFESLCASYGGDIALPTMLKELLKTETIERAENGLLRVLRRYYQPSVLDDASLLWAAGMIRDLAETTNNDLFQEGKSEPQFVGDAVNTQVALEAIPEFRKFMNERGQAFLEEIDAWLTQHENKEVGEDTDTVRLGVGVFTIQDTTE